MYTESWPQSLVTSCHRDIPLTVVIHGEKRWKDDARDLKAIRKHQKGSNSVMSDEHQKSKIHSHNFVRILGSDAGTLRAKTPYGGRNAEYLSGEAGDIWRLDIRGAKVMGVTDLVMS